MRGRPLVLLSIAFATGVLLSAFWHPFGLACFLGVCLMTALFAVTGRIRRLHSALYLLAALLGALRYGAASTLTPDDISRFAPGLFQLTGVVDSDSRISRSPAANPTGWGRANSGQNGTRILTLILAAEQIRPGDTGSASVSAGAPVTDRVELRLPIRLPDSNTDVTLERDSLPEYGDRITLYGRLETPSGARNPGGFDEHAYLARKGVHAVVMARRPEDWRVLAGGTSGNPLLGIPSRLHAAIVRLARRALPSERAAVLNGILLGDRKELPSALQDDFERTGTIHILATAGLHIGMAVVLLLGLWRRVSIPRRAALVLTIAALALYVPIAGERAAVVRAAVVATIYLIGELLEREPDLPNALALAALILLFGDPASLFDRGFQMSFCIVVTILCVLPFMESWRIKTIKHIRGEWRGMRLARIVADRIVVCFSLALAAQIGALPLVAYYDNTISLTGIVANTLIVPCVAAILALGFSAIAVGAVRISLSLPLFAIVNLLLGWIIECVRACSHVPYAAVSVASPPVPLIIVWYAAVWLGAAWLRNRIPEESLPNPAGAGRIEPSSR